MYNNVKENNRTVKFPEISIGTLTQRWVVYLVLQISRRMDNPVYYLKLLTVLFLLF